MEKENTNKKQDIVDPELSVFKHQGEVAWEEKQSLKDLSDEEYYDLWEGDRI